jgi:hypothetical protein
MPRNLLSFYRTTRSLILNFLKNILSKFLLLGFIALTASGQFAYANEIDQNDRCDGPGQARVDGVCKQIYAHVEATPMFIPERIKIGSGPSAYYLDPTTENSSWDKCKTGVGAQDSTCVVPYRYGVAAGLATITGGFTVDSPVVGGSGTKPRWTTTNAKSLTINCTGAVTYSDANAPVQNNPSSILFNAPAPGLVTCVLVALNSDNEPATLTIRSTFVIPSPPTIQAGFSRAAFDVGTGGANIIWNSTNAKSVHVACTGFNWGPGFVALQGNPSGVKMDRDTTGPISCTFIATNDVGQTATATTTANVTRPALPSVSGGYSPANITAGQQSQLIYSSANATVLGIVCNGLKGNAVQSPSMLLNQQWYWNFESWPNPGTQSCNIHAHNSLGEVAVMTFDLVVAPVGFTPSGGGSSGEGVGSPGDPGYIPPTGSGSSSGKPVGYYNPVTGLTYSDPAGTEPCGTCRTDPGTQVNSTEPTTTNDTPSTTETTGTTTTSNSP